MPRLTSEQRYQRILEQAWRRYGQSRALPPRELRRILERLDDRLKAGLLSLADLEGNVHMEDMPRVRRLLQDGMEDFRRSYEPWLFGSLYTAANAALNVQREAVTAYLGFGVGFSPSLPFDVVHAIERRIMGGLNLSERIWRLDWGTRSLLERDILASISEGQRASEMARRITQYLLPGRELPTGVPSSAYSLQPRDVSYNSWRLARTEINHTYAEMRNRSDKELADMGLALGTRWMLSGAHRDRMLKATKGKSDRDICDDWAERLPGTTILRGQPDVPRNAEIEMLAKLEQYGIDPRGVYLPGESPLDHPNGLCYTVTVMVPREGERGQ